VDMLETWFKASKEETQAVFGEQITSLNILNPRATSVSDSLVISDNMPFTISPNPTIKDAAITFELKTADFVSIDLYSVLGSRISKIYQGNTNPGRYSISIGENLAPGSYLVNLRTKNRSYTQRFIVIK
jgi:hypothetical protein